MGSILSATFSGIDSRGWLGNWQPHLQVNTAESCCVKLKTPAQLRWSLLTQAQGSECANLHITTKFPPLLGAERYWIAHRPEVLMAQLDCVYSSTGRKKGVRQGAGRR
eukprot:587700-Rhodomonas_salina.4